MIRALNSLNDMTSRGSILDKGQPAINLTPKSRRVSNSQKYLFYLHPLDWGEKRLTKEFIRRREKLLKGESVEDDWTFSKGENDMPRTVLHLKSENFAISRLGLVARHGVFSHETNSV